MGFVISEGSGLQGKTLDSFRSGNAMSFWELVEKPSAQEMAKIQDKGGEIFYCFYAFLALESRMAVVNKTWLLEGQVFLFFLAQLFVFFGLSQPRWHVLSCCRLTRQFYFSSKLSFIDVSINKQYIFRNQCSRTLAILASFNRDGFFFQFLL